MEALKESAQLWLKSKPPRPHLGIDRKLLIAGSQHFKCAGDRTRCPMWRLHDGSFDESGFEIDHITPWHAAHAHRGVGQLRALCHSCHALRTRLDRIASQEEEKAT
jgi:hypothetical protein